MSLIYEDLIKLGKSLLPFSLEIFIYVISEKLKIKVHKIIL